VTGGELGPAARSVGGGRAGGNGDGPRPERPKAQTPNRSAGMVRKSWQCAGSRTGGYSDGWSVWYSRVGYRMTTDSSGSCLALESRIIPLPDAS